MEKLGFFNAADIAQERFEKYLNKKLSESWELEKWEFYTFLLEQVKKHHLDCSGYEPLAYQQDKDESIRQNKNKSQLAVI